MKKKLSKLLILKTDNGFIIQSDSPWSDEDGVEEICLSFEETDLYDAEYDIEMAQRFLYAIKEWAFGGSNNYAKKEIHISIEPGRKYTPSEEE